MDRWIARSWWSAGRPRPDGPFDCPSAPPLIVPKAGALGARFARGFGENRAGSRDARLSTAGVKLLTVRDPVNNAPGIVA